MLTPSLSPRRRAVAAFFARQNILMLVASLPFDTPMPLRLIFSLRRHILPLLLIIMPPICRRYYAS